MNLPVSYLTPADVFQLCRSLQIRPTKTLGQNFVTDAGTVKKIVQAAQLDPADQVLEVGPGLGSLTLGLLAAGVQVTAVEIDPKLATMLPATIKDHAPQAAENLRLIHKDALKLDYANWVGASSISGKSQGGNQSSAGPTCLVSNLPYNVAVPVILHCLATFPTLRRVLVMVQKEVALRLSAVPGNKLYGIPSVKLAWYGQARLAGKISRKVFFPIPNVDSALVSLEVDPTYPPEFRQCTFDLVDQAFAARRKMLRGTLKTWAAPWKLDRLLAACQIDPTVRAETLTLQQFFALASLKSGLETGFATSNTQVLPAAAGELDFNPASYAGQAGGKPEVAGAWVSAQAPAKINLLLRCAGPNANGYHRLSSLFQGLDLYEQVSLQLIPEGTQLLWDFGCQSPNVQTYGYDPARDQQAVADLDLESNLAVRAFRLLAKLADYRGGVRIKIRKAIPVAAGMAGGSADAAACLLGANLLLGLDLSRGELADLAASLGADVPFGIYGGTAFGTRYGDQIFPLPVAKRQRWVFAVSKQLLPTAEVFQTWDCLNAKKNLACLADQCGDREESQTHLVKPDQLPRLGDLTLFLSALYRGDGPDLSASGQTQLAELMANDLQTTAISLRPALAETISSAQLLGAICTLVSGSGPTVGCLCPDEATQIKIAETLAKRPEVAYTIRVCSTGPSGPNVSINPTNPAKPTNSSNLNDSTNPTNPTGASGVTDPAGPTDRTDSTDRSGLSGSTGQKNWQETDPGQRVVSQQPDSWQGVDSQQVAQDFWLLDN